MNSVAIATGVLVVLLGAAGLGMLIRDRLPDHHLNIESRDVIKAATAIIATLSALALGLLIASAKNAYDAADSEIRTSAARLMLLDDTMDHYGPETATARAHLREVVQFRLDHVWEDGHGIDLASRHPGIDIVQNELRQITPQTDAQRRVLQNALDVAMQLAEAQWLLVEMGEEGLPAAFLGVISVWLALLFFTFGLLAPSNVTVVFTLSVSAVCVAGALFLIVDMAHPYRGLVRISDAPLRAVLSRIAT